jgi:hypothetical protein
MQTDRQQFREILAGLAAKTLTKIPALNGRVEKGCKLVLGGDVELLDDGTAQVGSLTDPAKSYYVGHGACDCQDFPHAPEHLCCHRLAVGFQRKVQELLPPPPATPVETEPLYEAPASINVHVQIAGRDCLLTLRGADEHQLLARLETVLARYPVPQTPAPSTAIIPPCPQHGVVKKGKHGYFCPVKTGDSYCTYTVKA